MKIVLDRPVAGYTELATDPTRERTSCVGFAGWHGLVLFGERHRPQRVERLEFYGSHVLVKLQGRPVSEGLTLEDALSRLFETLFEGR